MMRNLRLAHPSFTHSERQGPMNKTLNTLMVAAAALCAPAAYAGTCVDVQNASDRESSVNRWVLTNSCKEAVDLSIRRVDGDRRVCTTLHMEPGVNRTFTQARTCGSLNQLTTGCTCMNQFSTQERQSP